MILFTNGYYLLAIQSEANWDSAVCLMLKHCCAANQISSSSYPIAYTSRENKAKNISFKVAQGGKICTKKNNTQDGNKHCEEMHFKFDLTFHMLQHTFSKVSVVSEKTVQ